jgi:hypothetical protein
LWGYRPSSSPPKGVYNPKAVILHAALLRQAFAHCAISLTAASRRSLGRVSVPVWGTTLSGPLPVVGLVGRYPTNYLMGRSPLLTPRKFPLVLLVHQSSCGISRAFARLSPALGQVSYVLRTRSPLSTLLHPVRLACIRHAASVHPEPGSNSPYIGSGFDPRPTDRHTGRPVRVLDLCCLTEVKLTPAFRCASLSPFSC